ncbi:MAG: ABC transporter ATP-binding protein [Methylobacteriaceae bacterium]|nr:ABC transporter ATP-binding protein [Methylobacteriaceae bacterium]
MTALRFRDLTLAYDGHPVVHHLDGAVARGALLAVVGPNGAGKSSLLKAIVGQLTPAGGALEVDPALRRRLAYLPQAAEVDLSFPLSVYDFVAMGLWRELGPFRGVGREAAARIAAALAAVGLDGFEARPIGALSGGQRQRMFFARLALQKAELILLDEPFNAIDEPTKLDLFALVERWHGEGRTVVAVLHDLALVRARFPQTLLLARDVVAWGPTATVLSPVNLARAAGMVEAFDPAADLCASAA